MADGPVAEIGDLYLPVGALGVDILAVAEIYVYVAYIAMAVVIVEYEVSAAEIVIIRYLSPTGIVRVTVRVKPADVDAELL